MIAHVRLRLRYWWRRWRYAIDGNEWAYCLRCGETWQTAARHDTWFKLKPAGKVPMIRGLFPLCEPCWQAAPIAEKLRYYRKLWEVVTKHHALPWELVERTVREET